jgi:hypothetical protein
MAGSPTISARAESFLRTVAPVAEVVQRCDTEHCVAHDRYNPDFLTRCEATQKSILSAKLELVSGQM